MLFRLKTSRAAAGFVAFVLLVIGLSAGVASPAEAATIGIGTISGQVRDQVPSSGTVAENCLRYSPATGTGSSATSSAVVTSPKEAIAAHGYAQGDTCPQNLSTTTQSALGIAPAATTSVTDGTPFLLARAAHYNNSILLFANTFTGQLDLTLGGFDAGANKVSFNWFLFETPNTANPCAFPSGPNQNGCADEIKFTNQISNQTVTKNGVTYKLVINGFSTVANGTTCPAAPGTSQPDNDFLTAESAITSSCIYSSLVQVRSLKIVKRTVAPAGVTAPAFTFSSTSDLDGSPWAASSFNLDPKSTTANSVTRQLVQGETVTASEALPAGDQWSLTGLSCVDGVGNPASGVTADLNARRLTVTKTPAPPSEAAGPITCTFTNTYTAKATLTLVKQVTGGGPAQPRDWTLSAAGPTPISGASGSNGATSQRVVVGSYQLSESGPIGYVQQPWVCTGASTNGAGGAVTVADGQNATCTVTNRFGSGNLRITKTVTTPAGGFSGGPSTTFSGSYTCGTAAAVPFTVSTGTAYTSPAIPAGSSCTVTETQPTGNLTNGSYSWAAPDYAPGKTVTIVDQQTATVGIINTINQTTGSLRISKVVEPRSGTPVSGYTGGAGRVFPIGYRCVIGAATTAAGTVNVTPVTPAIVTDIPATSVCTTTETVKPAGGDFVDASYSWDGNAVAPATVKVTGNQTGDSTVTNYFRRNFSSLVLKKIVSGPGYVGTGAPFEVTYNCGSGATAVQLAANGSSTVSVPANTVCTVAETAPAANLLDPAYEWGSPTYAGLTNGSVLVAANGTATVTVTNPTVPVFGTVTVTKAITPTDFSAAVASGTTFAVSVSCDAPAQGDKTNYTDTFKLAINGSGTTPNLPVGTSCTVSETAPTGSDGLIDPSYVWGAGPKDQKVTVGQKDTTVTATVTNVIQRAYGSLAITKAVTASGAVDGAGTTFSGTFSCQYGNDKPVSGTWIREGAGAATLAGLPAEGLLIGSVCNATENPPSPAAPQPGDSSYIWGAESITGPVTVTTATPRPSIGVTNPVRRLAGDLAVSKVVNGGRAGTAFVDDPFPFNLSCIPQGGGAAITASLPTRAGGTAALPKGTDIPANSRCTVVEDANPKPIDPYRWETAVGFAVSNASKIDSSGRTVSFTTPADGSPVVVEVTNTIGPRLLSLTVTKKVDDPDGGFTDPKVGFDVSVVCGTTSYGIQAVQAGATATFAGIPLGSTCQASEGPIPTGAGLLDGSFSWSATPVVDPDSVTLSDEGGSYAFTVVNTVNRVRTTIGLRKVLDVGDYPGVVPADRTYSGSWTCRHAGDPDVDGAWKVTGPGVATLDGPADSVLVASDCTASEDPLGSVSPTDPSFSWNPAQITGITVDGTGADTLEVANSFTRQTGTVTVAKRVTGLTDGYTGTGADFVAAYRCYLSDPAVGPFYDGELAIKAGADPVALASDIPLGWTCGVRETLPGADLLRDSSYAWSAPVITLDGEAADSVKIDADGAAALVDNAITRITSTISVSKAYAAGTPDGAIPAGTTFTGGYSCVYDRGQPTEESFTGAWSVAGEGPATLTPAPILPLGTICTVSEDALDNAALVDASYVWAKPVLSAAVTVQNRVDRPDLSVTNAVRRVYSDLAVTKQYSGPTAALPTGLQVQGSWVCTYRGARVAAGRWTLPATGGSVPLFAADGSVRQNGQPLLVPATALCSVDEDTRSDADLTDDSYRWKPIVYTPVDGTVTLTPAGGQAVTVANATERVFGDLIITKVIAGDGPVDTSVVFAGIYTCQYKTDDPVTGAWQITDAGSQTVAGILVGSVCTLTEEIPNPPVLSDPSFIWLPAQITPDSTTVTATGSEDPASLTVTNTARRLTGSFGLTKALSGATAGEPAGQTYTWSYRCLARNGDVVSGTSDPIAVGELWNGPTTIAVGSRCTVKEQGLPDLADPAYSWGEPSYAVSGVGENGAPVTDAGVEFTIPGTGGVPDAATPVVTTTNPLSQNTGSVVVGTLVTGAVAGYVGGTFAVDLSCWSFGTNPAQDPPSLQQNLTLVPKADQTVDGIPLGSQCRVAESDARPVPADPSYTWGTPTYSVDGQAASTFAVRSSRTPVVAIVTNPLARAYGDFSIAKSVTGTGVPAGLPAGAAYTFDYSCQVPGADDPVTGTLAVTADGGATPYAGTERLAQGTVCTITEPVADLPGLDRGFGWGAVTYTVDNSPAAAVGRAVTVTIGTDTTVAVSAANDLQRDPGGYAVTKTADPPSGSTVQAGDVITYTVTVTVTPSGKAPVADAVVTDDLSQLTPYATLVDGSIDAAQGAAAITGDALTWTVGTVDGADPITLTYQFTVGDVVAATLRNAVTATGEVPPTNCDPCSTEHRVPGLWTLSKSSDPASGSTVDPAAVITYSLEVQNLSDQSGVRDIVVTDDLSDVLDDASFLGVDPPGVGSASRAGDTLTWSIPELAPGAVETLSYRVRVDAGANGVSLRNVVVGTAPGNPPDRCAADQLFAARVSLDSACATEHQTPPRPEHQHSGHHHHHGHHGDDGDGGDGGDDGDHDASLPNTGASSVLLPILAVGGILVLGGGAVLMLVGRRRRDESSA